MNRSERDLIRFQATEALEKAEALLAALVDSYTEEKDGKFSACHPKLGLSSTAGQITKLRRALSKARV